MDENRPRSRIERFREWDKKAASAVHRFSESRSLDNAHNQIVYEVDQFIRSRSFDITLIGITAGLWIYCWYCAQSGMRYITTGMWMFTTWGLTALLLVYYGWIIGYWLWNVIKKMLHN